MTPQRAANSAAAAAVKLFSGPDFTRLLSDVASATVSTKTVVILLLMSATDSSCQLSSTSVSEKKCLSSDSRIVMTLARHSFESNV